MKRLKIPAPIINNTGSKKIEHPLSLQSQIPRIKKIFVQDISILSLLSKYQARSYKAVPLEKAGTSLKVALTNPDDLQVLDDLRLITKHEITPVLAEEKEIEVAIKKYYGMPEIEGDFPELEVVENEALDLDYTAEALNEEAPAVKLINKIITEAVEEEASDIHLEPNANYLRVRYRVDGLLREAMVLPRRAQPSLVARLKILAELNIAERRLPQDGRIQIKHQSRVIDLRISTLPTVFGEKVVVRLLDKSRQPDSLNQLGFKAKNLTLLQKMIKSAYGMILFSGPTGSGKTTTLYAILKNLNTLEKNIVTIEDPVEYMLEGINQCQVKPKAGFTFAAGIRSMLRQDPDIIMVGEIRDKETAKIAIQAANTGHLVLSTIHTNDAPGAVIRLIDMEVEPFLVASSLLGVVAQRLVRTICRYCREPYKPEKSSPEDAFLQTLLAGEKEKKLPVLLYKGRGCPFCSYTGYRGRTALMEVFTLTKELKELVLAQASSDELRQVAYRQGMTGLKEDALNKIFQGVTTVSEVMRVTYEGE